ncbi:serine acetyltransferase [Halobacillus locisalis]|uniref:Serine acetyltransferase n=1 Tax=Halobacillus locisalis TaxID=220753 RepID=A0A838CT97_9BACI|nr:DapH/DapD/GlmU-related protein [Halobacillus locisalis]MBA2175362.1 serine acetyltransferase [Halobacillus locisalis]
MNAINLYKIARFLNNRRIPFIPKLIKGVIFLLYNSVIPYTAVIGEHSKLAYGGIGTVIHSKTTIGKRVLIGQNVTIGRALDPDGVPYIGDNVYISAGVRIIGNVTVGNNVIIGANAVVTKDIPDNCIIAGVPAKVIRIIDHDIYDLLKNIY